MDGSTNKILQQNRVSSLADRLFGAVTGQVESGRPALPSFTYKGIPFSADAWERDVKQLEAVEAYEKYEVTYKAPDNLLRLRIIYTIYNEYPVVEWLPFLEATGDLDSGIVDNFRSLNVEIPINETWDFHDYPIEKIRLRRNLGAMTREDDFSAQDVWMTDRYPLKKISMDACEGRSSDAWLPFFGVDFDDNYGFNVAIGWSGKWSANFELMNYLTFKADAGMYRTHFRVRPGESIRQPSIFIMLRDGMSVEDCTNLHRRFMLDFHSPHDSNGNLIRPQYAAVVWGGQTNDTVISYLDEIEKRGLKFNLLWMDAGWYGEDRNVATDEFNNSDWATTVGNWRVNQIPHPGGLSPIAERAHALGMNFMLWVEMERIIKGSPVAKEHPAWVLKNPAEPEGSLLLNLGNPDARKWAVDTVRRLVDCEGVDYYREDFNFNTVPYWRAADTEERQGITEAKFIAGFYEFWDELRKLYPDMMIDNCASGGRRMDFETASRSVCMYRSDIIGRPFYDSSNAQLSQFYYLAQWMPLFGGCVWLRQGEEFQALACASFGVSYGCGYNPSSQDPSWEKALSACTMKMQEYMTSDLHLLTEHPETGSNWVAYQLHNPETESGFFAAFRTKDTPQKEIELRLSEISSRSNYAITEGISGKTTEIKGSDLAKYVVSGAPQTAHVFFYAKLRKSKH